MKNTASFKSAELSSDRHDLLTTQNGRNATESRAETIRIPPNVEDYVHGEKDLKEKVIKYAYE